MNIESVDVPPDETPVESDAPSADFNPEFPGSTEEAPYGFFPDGRARKRRPHGSGKTSTSTTAVRRSPASESQARTAAGLLARMNGLVALGLMSFLPNTVTSLAAANEQFENMAYEALLADPALCRKILSAGATSGKAGLAMAYVMLGASIAPVAYSEVREIRSSGSLLDTKVGG